MVLGSIYFVDQVSHNWAFGPIRLRFKKGVEFEPSIHSNGLILLTGTIKSVR